MRTPFRKPVLVSKRLPGSRVNGRWVEGTLLPPETLMLTVQPASAGDHDQLRAEPGGRRLERVIRVYADEELNVAGQDEVNGDVVLWEGEEYLIVAISRWRTTALKHYRYLAGKLPP